MDENTALNDTTNATTTKDQEWKKKGYMPLVVSLVLLLVVAFYAGQSRGARTSLAGSATEVVLVGAATASVVSSVEADGEDSNNNEDGPISGGGSVVEEAQSKEQESAPSSTTIRRRKLKPKDNKTLTATTGQACVQGGASCSSARCCSRGTCKIDKKGANICESTGTCDLCRNKEPCCSDAGVGLGSLFDNSCPGCSDGRI